MTGTRMLLDTAFGLTDLPALRGVLGDCAIASGLTGQRGEEFVLAAYELLASAIEHGGGRIQVHCTAGQLRCQIHTRGPGMPADTADGCGLDIADTLADQLDIRRHHDGATAALIMNIPAASGIPSQYWPSAGS